MKGDADKSTNDSMRTRVTMVLRLRNSEDELTWDVFYERYKPLIYGFALKRGLSHEESEEVCDDVFIEVSVKIAEFETNRGKGSFRSWLFQRTEWRVKDAFRKRCRELPCNPHASDDSSSTSDGFQVPVPPEMEKSWDAEFEKSRLAVAMDVLARKIPAKQYQAFQLHAVREWPAKKVGESLGMERAHVYVNTHRVRKLLRKILGDLEDGGLGAGVN